MTWASGKVTPLSVLNFAITNSWRSPVSGFAGTSWARRAGQSRNRRSNFFMRDPQPGTRCLEIGAILASGLRAESTGRLHQPFLHGRNAPAFTGSGKHLWESARFLYNGGFSPNARSLS